MKTLTLPFHVHFYLEHSSHITLELRWWHKFQNLFGVMQRLTNSEFQQILLKTATAETYREYFVFASSEPLNHVQIYNILYIIYIRYIYIIYILFLWNKNVICCVIYLWQRQLTKSEISFLSKGSKFVTTPNKIDKTKP